MLILVVSERERTHKSDGVAAGVDPIVLIANELRVGKPVRVHQRAEGLADGSLLRSTEETCWVRRIVVFGLVLSVEKDAYSQHFSAVEREHIVTWMPIA